MNAETPGGAAVDGTPRPSGAPSVRAYTIVVYPPVAGPVRKAWLNANDRIHWSQKAKLTRDWRANAWGAAMCVQMRPTPWLVKAHVVATLHFGDDRRRDVGNYAPTVKAAVDGLVDAGVIPDDSDRYLIGPDLRRGDASGVPRIVLTVTELS